VVAVWSSRLAVEDSGGIKKRRPHGQVKDALPGVGWVDVLYSEHRQVLGNAVAKDRTKGPYIERTAITYPNHGLGTKLIRNAQPRRKIGVRVPHATVEGYAVYTGNFHFSGIQLQPSAISGAGYGLGIVDFPAQAIVDREPGRHTPRVLRVSECACLPLPGMQGAGNIAAERVHLSQQVRG
jgi:hypothetical protein